MRQADQKEPISMRIADAATYDKVHRLVTAVVILRDKYLAYQKNEHTRAGTQAYMDQFMDKLQQSGYATLEAAETALIEAQEAFVPSKKEGSNGHLRGLHV